MTFASVLLFCSAGIAGCAALVFIVETVVAFCLHEQETVTRPQPPLLCMDAATRDFDELKRHIAA